MENLLSSQPLYNFRKKVTPKKKIIYKFKIIEDNKESNYIRNNYIIKIDSLSKRLLSYSKPAKPKDYFPLIKKNFTIGNNINIEEKTNNNLRLNKRYQSKEEIGRSLLPYNLKRNLNINNTIIHNNKTFSEEIDDNKYHNNINTSISQPKKCKLNFEEFLEENNKKNDLKLIKLSKINDNKKKALEISNKKELFNKGNNIFDYQLESNFNKNHNISKKDKLILGSKYSTFDISPESISRNLYYSRLNTYCNQINKKLENKKKINFSKLDLHNIKLRNYHHRKIKKWKKLIDNTVLEVNGIKNNCMNWINELREKYSDLYKGLGVEFNDII